MKGIVHSLNYLELVTLPHPRPWGGAGGVSVPATLQGEGSNAGAAGSAGPLGSYWGLDEAA